MNLADPLDAALGIRAALPSKYVQCSRSHLGLIAAFASPVQGCGRQNSPPHFVWVGKTHRDMETVQNRGSLLLLSQNPRRPANRR